MTEQQPEQTIVSQTGYIYILYNEVFTHYKTTVDEPNTITVKIGKTNDIQKRLNGYTTAYLKPSEIKHLSQQVKQYTLAEKMIHNRLVQYRMKRNREFFQMSLDIAISTIDEVVDLVNGLTDDEINNMIDSLKQQSVTKHEYKKRIIVMDTHKKQLIEDIVIDCGFDSLNDFQTVITNADFTEIMAIVSKHNRLFTDKNIPKALFAIKETKTFDENTLNNSYLRFINTFLKYANRKIDSFKVRIKKSKNRENRYRLKKIE
jgi:hypothetical protein